MFSDYEQVINWCSAKDCDPCSDGLYRCQIISKSGILYYVHLFYEHVCGTFYNYNYDDCTNDVVYWAQL